MNVEYINPFIQGAQSVMMMLCNEAPSLGVLYIKGAPYEPAQVSVAVSVLGDVKGLVVYNMPESAGCFIASKMMCGMPVEALDEMSQSAVSELANMISGNVATIFAGKGLNIDISTPRFLMNAVSGDFPTVTASNKMVCIPMNFQEGHTMQIDVSIA